MTGVAVPLFLFLTLLRSLLSAGPADRPVLEPIEWTDMWVRGADKRNVRRVLLVGDSIVRGYYRVVEKELGDRVYLARFTTSMFLANPDYLSMLELLLRRYKFEVIHINNGLHGFGCSEEEYQAGFEPLFDLLKRAAPRAALIWATTTPVRKRGKLSEFNEKSTVRVKERNRIAVRFMKKLGVPVNDLFALVAGHPEYSRSDGVHFNAKGNQVLGK